MINLQLPLKEEDVRKLKIGDEVSISGIIVTARDRAHKYLIENFIDNEPPEEEKDFYPIISQLLEGGIIYHCGPIVKKVGETWEFISAGPTTSIREEPYEYKVIKKFQVRGIIGKGGMGPNTLQACKEYGAVYLHAVGGAGSLIAKYVKKVYDVYKTEFGLPEAFWKIEVEGFKAVVTMDSHGGSLHKTIEDRSREILERFIH